MSNLTDEKMASEYSQRKGLWVVLSDLFLDTDVYLFYDGIARECAQSVFSIKELKQILFYEVAPVCFINLTCPVGEWAGFDEDWLATEINEKIHKRNNKNTILSKVSQWMSGLFYQRYCRFHWDTIEATIVEYRALKKE